MLVNKGEIMILTVCPSPCIDVNIEVERLSVGKSNKIKNKTTYYTGKAINVAVGLARLNADVFITGFMYKENGNQFEHELHRDGVPYSFVWNEGRVRENYKIIDHRSMLTEVDDVSPEVTAEKQAELVGLVGSLAKDCDGIVICGGLAKGMTAEFYREVLNAVPSGVIKIADTEGERLVQALKCGVNLVKPNLEELERTLNKTISSKEDMVEACRKILDMGTEYVLLSLGKRGAVITDGAKFFHCMSVNVAKNSTVGAGDAMLAAASSALIRGGSMQEVLRCGVAAGTAAVTSPDSISFIKEKYEEILSALTVKEI